MAKSKSNLLNYTTQIAAEKTVGEIQSLLVKKGATSVTVEYVNQSPTAVSFVVLVGSNYVPFLLKPNLEGVLRKLPDKRDMARAQRVGWRIVFRWIEAQMAMVEMNLVELAQVFLPYAVSIQGATVWDNFLEANNKQLGAGAL